MGMSFEMIDGDNAMIYFEINFDGYHQMSVRGTKDTPLKNFYKENTLQLQLV